MRRIAACGRRQRAVECTAVLALGDAARLSADNVDLELAVCDRHGDRASLAGGSHTVAGAGDRDGGSRGGSRDGVGGRDGVANGSARHGGVCECETDVKSRGEGSEEVAGDMKHS